jgi:hypothetical protein
VIRLDGDTASGRAYLSELIRLRDGGSLLTGSPPARSGLPTGPLW